MMRNILILLGPPGAGKGSVGGELSAYLKVPIIASGDLLRENVRKAVSLGMKAKKYMDSGELVPDDIVIKMIGQKIAEPNCSKGFILDGFPRTLAQAEMLDGIKVEGDSFNVFYLKAEDDFLIKRLSKRRVCGNCGKIYHLVNLPPKREGICDICGGSLVQRKDDTEEVIRKRLEVYKDLTAPLLKYYRDKGYLHVIAGDISIDYMMNAIKKIMKW
ncbi:MAG TPA: adenylate kinase [bacterium]|nr:adenylate kinase [bacterium]